MWLFRALFVFYAFHLSSSLNDYCSACGVVKPQTRIFNGQISNYSPWTVYILVNKNTIICTGTIIDFNNILTEAHCLFQNESLDATQDLNDINIYAGSTVKGSLDSTVLKVQSVHLHPEYKYTAPNVNSFNDLAIIKLKKRLNISKKVRPVCLGDVHVKTNDEVLIQGFGLRNFEQDSFSLLEANLKIQSDEDCKKVYKNMYTPEHLCAKNGSAGYGSACGGDSGGGLFKLKKNRQYIIGVTSFGGHCDHFPNQAMVFTRVSSYIKWIRDITGNSFNCDSQKKFDSE